MSNSTPLPELDALFRIGVSQEPLTGGVKPHKQKGKTPNKQFKGLRYRRTHYVHTGRLRICWHWTTVRNLEGYFVGCREVYDKDKGRGFRDDWMQRKARWRVSDWALTQFNNSPYKKVNWTYPLHTPRK